MAGWLYEVEIVGKLDDLTRSRLEAEFGDLVTTVAPVSTMVRGAVVDQSGLIGLLEQLHSLGLTVCAVRRLPHSGTTPESVPRRG
jgi:hypothetical protein